MFASTSLAARIELSEARLSRAVGEATRDVGAPDTLVTQVGSGVAVFAGAGSPVNKIIGLGFGDAGTIDPAALDAVEQWFDERQAPLQAEVSILANPDAWRTLAERGYRLDGFENVLALDLAAWSAAPVSRADVLSIACEADPRPEWLDAMIKGFSHPDGREQHVVPPGREPAEPAAPSPVLPPRTMFERFYATPGFRRYVARWEGALAGVGSLRLDAGLAQLCGAATLPAFRRNGIQSALFVRRLQDAQEHGCDLATVTTQPGSKSQQNAQRQGFALLYTRALLVKG